MAQWCCHVNLNGSTLGIKEATFAKAETLLHGHSFVQTIDSFQIIISKVLLTWLYGRMVKIKNLGPFVYFSLFIVEEGFPHKIVDIVLFRRRLHRRSGSNLYFFCQPLSSKPYLTLKPSAQHWWWWIVVYYCWKTSRKDYLIFHTSQSKLEIKL